MAFPSSAGGRQRFDTTVRVRTRRIKPALGSVGRSVVAIRTGDGGAQCRYPDVASPRRRRGRSAARSFRRADLGEARRRRLGDSEGAGRAGRGSRGLRAPGVRGGDRAEAGGRADAARPHPPERREAGRSLRARRRSRRERDRQQPFHDGMAAEERAAPNLSRNRPGCLVRPRRGARQDPAQPACRSSTCSNNCLALLRRLERDRRSLRAGLEAR